jgi:hypothetical protein
MSIATSADPQLPAASAYNKSANGSNEIGSAGSDPGKKVHWTLAGSASQFACLQRRQWSQSMSFEQRRLRTESKSGTRNQLEKNSGAEHSN